MAIEIPPRPIEPRAQLRGVARGDDDWIVDVLMDSKSRAHGLYEHQLKALRDGRPGAPIDVIQGSHQHYQLTSLPWQRFYARTYMTGGSTYGGEDAAFFIAHGAGPPQELVKLPSYRSAQVRVDAAWSSLRPTIGIVAWRADVLELVDRGCRPTSKETHVGAILIDRDEKRSVTFSDAEYRAKVSWHVRAVANKERRVAVLLREGADSEALWFPRAKATPDARTVFRLPQASSTDAATLTSDGALVFASYDWAKHQLRWSWLAPGAALASRDVEGKVSTSRFLALEACGKSAIAATSAKVGTKWFVRISRLVPSTGKSEDLVLRSLQMRGSEMLLACADKRVLVAFEAEHDSWAYAEIATS